MPLVAIETHREPKQATCWGVALRGPEGGADYRFAVNAGSAACR
jgi:hypothetical protein